MTVLGEQLCWRRLVFLVAVLGGGSAVHGFTTTFRSPLTTITSTTTTTASRHGQSQKQHQPQSRCRLATATYAQRNEYQHTLAILSMPSTSTDKIANEAILNQAIQHKPKKLSVVLRAQGRNPSLARLRQYVGEVYSTLWDVAMATTGDASDFCDVVVYPQNLPNAAPEQWINHMPDLDSVCSHDSICGWISSSAQGRGLDYQSKQGQGFGGLLAHVSALNADRAQRHLPAVTAIPVDPWPLGASAELQQENHVAFLDDELEEQDKKTTSSSSSVNGAPRSLEDDDDDTGNSGLLGGARVPTGVLFEQVAVGGTFDGMHYGHRKLLTLAVSSVNPVSGKLMIGVTVDDMLRHKSYAEDIPKLQERMDGARDFIYRLAPGIKNRVRLIPISDEYGPPGTLPDVGQQDFDALVLSHETLENGCKLNDHRVEKGLPPLTLLCTRRTEPHGMSSTALRRRRYEQKQQQKAKI
jgi:cytidyltransferase-like protein